MEEIICSCGEIITNQALEMCDTCWDEVMAASIPGNIKPLN